MTKNLTIALDDQLIKRARLYAAERGTTLNVLLRQLLEEEVGDRVNLTANETFRLMDEAGPQPTPGKWSREDVYDRTR